GLPGSLRELPAQPLPDSEWQPVLQQLMRRRVAGLALRAALEGDLAVTPTQMADIAEVHRTAMVSALRIERALLEALDALEGAGIEPRILKGAFAAHALYASPSDRI